MKPIKDKFNISDIKKSGERITDLLVSYCEKNGLDVCWSQYSQQNVTVAARSSVGNYMQNNLNARSFFKNTFQICEEPNMSPSHNITILDDQKFYKEAFPLLSNEDKIIFIKTISRHTDRYVFAENLNSFSEEDFWLHLRHYAQFSNNTKQSGIFKNTMDSLSNKTIDTEEKAQSLMQFFHYYKTIINRTDTKNTIYRFIERNVTKEFQEHFEKFLKFKISDEPIKEDSYLKSSTNLIVLTLDKEEIFKSLPLVHFNMPEVYNYNQILELIKDIVPKTQSEDTGISHMVVQEFSSKKNPAKLYIEAGDAGFKVDINEYMKLLLSTCANNYNKKLSLESVKDMFSDTLNYYLISKSLNNNFSTNEQPRKKLKI